jgi:hypothetical protein
MFLFISSYLSDGVVCLVEFFVSRWCVFAVVLEVVMVWGVMV